MIMGVGRKTFIQGS